MQPRRKIEIQFKQNFGKLFDKTKFTLKNALQNIFKMLQNIFSGKILKFAKIFPVFRGNFIFLKDMSSMAFHETITF